ncbi:hypothetical protein A1O3_02717 [Capronia epimyces CBS 606.96]|uniref:Oxidoreductase n=1 Tax=Capronia epimyces CBS 606.96 TaxID=1182542 RepID=W9YIY8_9EURO|nr:uncharacterized protein A1O3_02717 [Capronia epimyces CBS 606.96]EXJ89650.1 hypothetical protein A1O3_02717 [Capronia epimyces CBS 606.96]
MSTPKKSVLITGCSDGGLGAALAIAFHQAGLHVYATARNPARLTEVQSHGIETLTLDVLSDSSIAACVAQVARLDILVNNAGALYSMPVSDLSMVQAKKLFDLNVWSYLAVTQAFLPLLLESKGVIVNQTSSAGVLNVPFQATYNASKAAMSMFSHTMRLELEPFGVRVVDLKTSAVVSRGLTNYRDLDRDISNTPAPVLPKGSIYEPAREVVERSMRCEYTTPEVTAEQWASQVVPELLKTNPPSNVWAGTKARMVRLLAMLPAGVMDGMMRKMTGLDVVKRMVGM